MQIRDGLQGVRGGSLGEVLEGDLCEEGEGTRLHSDGEVGRRWERVTKLEGGHEEEGVENRRHGRGWPGGDGSLVKN